jgi:L-threonylcarbamoyladenylate synthase
VARTLAREAGGALVSTSANLAGEPPPVSAGALAPALRARLDAVLDGGLTPGGLPSTVAALEEGALRVVRAGAIAPQALERALRKGER